MNKKLNFRINLTNVNHLVVTATLNSSPFNSEAFSSLLNPAEAPFPRFLGPLRDLIDSNIIIMERQAGVNIMEEREREREREGERERDIIKQTIPTF